MVNSQCLCYNQRCVSLPLQGHVVRNWKVRWFVLLQDKLLYYKIEGGKKEPSPKGRILLDGCTITCPCLEYENRPVWVEKCISSLCHLFSNFFLSFPLLFGEENLLWLLQPYHWGASRIRPSQKQAATSSVTGTSTELPHCVPKCESAINKKTTLTSPAVHTVRRKKMKVQQPKSVWREDMNNPIEPEEGGEKGKYLW